VCCSGQNQTTTETKLNPGVQSAYDSLLQRYQTLGNQQYTPYSGERVAGFSPDQQAAFGTVNTMQGLGQPYVDQAGLMTQQGSQVLTTNDIMARYNPAIQGQVDALQNDLYAQNARTLQASNSNAAKVGALTGDRSQVAAQIAQDPANRDAAMATSQLRSNAFNQASNLAQADQNRMLAGGQQYAGLGAASQNLALQGAQAQLATGGLQQQYEQAKLDAPYQEYLTAQAYPYMQAQFLGQGIGALGSAYGTSTTTTVPKPSLWSQIAGLGATAAGAYMGSKDGGRIERNQGGPTINIGAAPQAANPIDPEFAQLTTNLGHAVDTLKGHMNGGAVIAGGQNDYGYAPGGAVLSPLAPTHDPDAPWADRATDAAGLRHEPPLQQSPWLPVSPRAEGAMRTYHPDDLGADGRLPFPEVGAPEFAVGGKIDVDGGYRQINPGQIQVANPEIENIIPTGNWGGGGRGPRTNSHQSVPQGSGLGGEFNTLAGSIGKYYGTPDAPSNEMTAESLAGWWPGTSVIPANCGGRMGYDAGGRTFDLEAPGTESQDFAAPQLAFDVNAGNNAVSPVSGVALDGVAPSELNPAGGVGMASSPISQDDFAGSEAYTQPDAMSRSSAAGDDGSYYETNPWHAVMMGGAATMAGDSPYAGINIGRGIGVGLNSYLRGLSEDRRYRSQERAADREAARLAEATSRWQQEFGLKDRQQTEAERHNLASEEAQRMRWDKEAQMEQRAAMATAAGLIPGTPAHQHYMLTGKLPTGISTGDIGAKISGGLAGLAAIPEKYADTFSNAVGPYRGNISNEGGGYLGGVGRAWGSLTSALEGDTNSPRDVRRDIGAGIESLTSVIKPLIRSPGEGAWTDADQQRLNYIVGDLTTVNDASEYYRALEGVNQRITDTFGIKLPPLQIPERYQNLRGMPNAAPPRPQTVPEGSKYSPSRKMWQDPEGVMYNADGSPANG
jgi:hypothetical protein